MQAYYIVNHWRRENRHAQTTMHAYITLYAPWLYNIIKAAFSKSRIIMSVLNLYNNSVQASLASLTVLAVAVCIPVRKKRSPIERAMHKLRWTKL